MLKAGTITPRLFRGDDQAPVLSVGDVAHLPLTAALERWKTPQNRRLSATGALATILPMSLNRKTTALFAAAMLTTGLATAAGPPETVQVTYHVQSGKLEEFLSVLKQHHPACRKHRLV